MTFVELLLLRSLVILECKMLDIVLLNYNVDGRFNMISWIENDTHILIQSMILELE